MLSKFAPNSPHLHNHLRKEHFKSDKSYLADKFIPNRPEPDLALLPCPLDELEHISKVLNYDPSAVLHFLHEKKK